MSCISAYQDPYVVSTLEKRLEIGVRKKEFNKTETTAKRLSLKQRGEKKNEPSEIHRKAHSISEGILLILFSPYRNIYRNITTGN